LEKLDRRVWVDCVEKVGFSRIFAVFNALLVFKTLFLLEINFTTLADFSRKGLFQHNRSILTFRNGSILIHNPFTPRTGVKLGTLQTSKLDCQ
jgi:hypothetical protein